MYESVLETQQIPTLKLRWWSCGYRRNSSWPRDECYPGQIIYLLYERNLECGRIRVILHDGTNVYYWPGRVDGFKKQKKWINFSLLQMKTSVRSFLSSLSKWRSSRCDLRENFGDGLEFYYRYNKKAWMNCSIYFEDCWRLWQNN